jgi:hypothetical protein
VAVLADVVIPSKLAISVIGWSLDGTKLAYESIDPALGLGLSRGRVYVSDLSGSSISAVGDTFRASGRPGKFDNPQGRPAAAWAKAGIVFETLDSAGRPMVGSRASSEVYSIPTDAKGNAYLIKADGTITSSDDTSVAMVAGGIDEGAFSSATCCSWLELAIARCSPPRPM